MATFAELVADVATITNRPDLSTEIELAVKVATLKAHHTDFYPKDLFETGLTWFPTGYQQSLEYRSIVPRWRAFKYLRKYTASSSTPEAFFSFLSVEDTLDSYGINRDDICYLAGDMLEIRSSTIDTNMLLGCYLHPITDATTYSSWIALDHPYAIVYEAASKIFTQIGWQEQAAEMKREVAEQFALLRNSNLLGNGY